MSNNKWHVRHERRENKWELCNDHVSLAAVLPRRTATKAKLNCSDVCEAIVATSCRNGTQDFMNEHRCPLASHLFRRATEFRVAKAKVLGQTVKVGAEGRGRPDLLALGLYMMIIPKCFLCNCASKPGLVETHTRTCKKAKQMEMQQNKRYGKKEGTEEKERISSALRGGEGGEARGGGERMGQKCQMYKMSSLIHVVHWVGS